MPSSDLGLPITTAAAHIDNPDWSRLAKFQKTCIYCTQAPLLPWGCLNHTLRECLYRCRYPDLYFAQFSDFLEQYRLQVWGLHLLVRGSTSKCLVVGLNSLSSLHTSLDRPLEVMQDFLHSLNGIFATVGHNSISCYSPYFQPAFIPGASLYRCLGRPAHHSFIPTKAEATCSGTSRKSSLAFASVALLRQSINWGYVMAIISTSDKSCALSIINGESIIAFWSVWEWWQRGANGANCECPWPT